MAPVWVKGSAFGRINLLLVLGMLMNVMLSSVDAFFSKDSKVQKLHCSSDAEGGRWIAPRETWTESSPMRCLNTGDRVLTSSGTHERIYLFGQRNPNVTTTFLQIHFQKNHASLDEK